MFYSTVRHHCKHNSVSLVWGTERAPHRASSCQLRGNSFHTWQNCSALLLVPLRVLVICNPAAGHPKMPRNYVEQLYASCGGIPLPLGPADLLKSGCASAPTQHNRISGVSHSASGLSYCSKLPSCVIQWEICHWRAGTGLLPLSCKCIQVSTVPPGLLLPSGNMERAISHPQFYTLWHAKVNQSIGTYRLWWEHFRCFPPAKTVSGDCCPCVEGVLRRGECSLWRCSRLQRAQRQPGARTLLQAAARRNSQHSLSWEDDQERREEVSKPAGRFLSQKSTMTETSEVYKSLLVLWHERTLTGHWRWSQQRGLLRLEPTATWIAVSPAFKDADDPWDLQPSQAQLYHSICPAHCITSLLNLTWIYWSCYRHTEKFSPRRRENQLCWFLHHWKGKTCQKSEAKFGTMLMWDRKLISSLGMSVSVLVWPDTS